MDYYGIDMKGALNTERLEVLPTWISSDVGRVVFITDEDELYIGGNIGWIIISEDSSDLVDRPTITVPTEGTADWHDTFTSSAFSTDDSYIGTHDYTNWQISYTTDFAIIQFESTNGNLTSWTQTISSSLQLAYIRVRHGSDYHLSSWSPTISFTTPNEYIQTPTNTLPTDTDTNIGETPTLTANAFVCVNGSDTHESSSWQVSTDSGFVAIVYESLADTSNLTTIDIPGENLLVGTVYYWRVKYTGTTYGDSVYSTTFSFTTANAFIVAGGVDFGVAPSYETLTGLGLAEMTGTTTSGHDNYGNYIQTATSSIMCHIPKFFYRVGNASSPQYAVYGANALDIVGTDVYADEATANAAGYSMHRAFIDGGAEKDGFFIDKYIASPADNNKGVSVKNGVPISLTTTAGYTKSSGMTGCTGILADAVVLSRARGTGYNNTSVFMMGAMAILSVAHAQAATATTYCAWYDASGTTNFPKGCNSSLADINDAAVTYTTAGDTDANKPLTGSASIFAKTTHNGQNNGVCDLNGGIREVALGLTNFGTSATTTTAIATDTIYLLKQSSALGDLTSGWDGPTDAWGNMTHLATLYDAVTSPHTLGLTTGVVYWGSGSNAVFSAATTGVSRDLCGFIPKDDSASDATGTNQFGNDYLYRYNIQNMYVRCCGSWNNAATAGLFYRHFYDYRTDDYSSSGFRGSAYV